MQYLVCKKQVGSGCDYTIGCGYLFEFVEAESEAALIEAIIWPYGRDEPSSLESDDWDDHILEQVFFAPSEHVATFDIASAKAKIEESRMKEKRDEIVAKELAELERLQKKYSHHLGGL